MSELTVAVVGAGAAGSVHLQCWSNLVGVRIASICDSNGMTAARAAADYPGSAAFQDYAAMLKSESVDIVDVCTPANSQFDVARAALAAGAHVLCETPFTASSTLADTLLRFAESRERTLTPALCHRLHPPVLFLKELLDSDELGRPTMFRCRFSGFWDEASVDQATGSLGALRGTAIHGIDLFRYLCGEIREATGRLARVNVELAVEDTATVLVTGESGVLGVIETSWSLPGGRSVLEVYGTAGSCIVDYDSGTVRYLTADQPIWRHHDVGGPNRFERQAAAFADSVRGLQEPFASAADASAAAAVCDAIYAEQV